MGFYCWRCNGINEECTCSEQYHRARNVLSDADLEVVRRSRTEAERRHREMLLSDASGSTNKGEIMKVEELELTDAARAQLAQLAPEVRQAAVAALAHIATGLAAGKTPAELGGELLGEVVADEPDADA